MKKEKGKLMEGRWHKHDGCCWSISNENPISKRACVVYGGREREEEKEEKRANKRKTKKLSGEDELRRKGIANPEGLRRDNDLQLPAVLFSILDKTSR